MLERATADAAWLVEHWPYLIEIRIPGTARPWRQAGVDPARRAELDALARAERHERAEEAPGEHEAPVHVDVLDVLNDLAATLESPEALADFATQLDQADEESLADVAADLARLKRDTAVALRLVYDGQRIGGCPWCGQDRALTIRVPDDPDEPVLVVCEGYGRICEPPSADCGRYVRGRPAWLLWAEGDWLAQRIARYDAQQPAVLAAVRPAKVYKVRDEWGREGCWLWQGAAADTPGPTHPRSCGQQACVRPEHIVRQNEVAYG